MSFTAISRDVAPGARYGLRAHGPYRSRARAIASIPPSCCSIPTPRRSTARSRLHPSMFGTRPDARAVADDADSAPFVPKAIVVGRPRRMPRRIAADRRGRTRSSTNCMCAASRMRTPGHPGRAARHLRGLAHPAAIEHLTRLGVTTVEIMPLRGLDRRTSSARALGLQQLLGLQPGRLDGARSAPGARRLGGGARDASPRLHAAGIEVILDVVLNHTGEGDALRPDAVAARPRQCDLLPARSPTMPRRYVDDAGCGNTLALDRPPVAAPGDGRAARLGRSAAACDGFRFDLATTLGRRAEGFDPAAPLLAAIAQDPLLRDLKLIAEPWDIGPGGYQLGAFPARLGRVERSLSRRRAPLLARRPGGSSATLATRLAGSADLFGKRRRPRAAINFVTAHDGFTLADLVSYDAQAQRGQRRGQSRRDRRESFLEQRRRGPERRSGHPRGARGAISAPCWRRCSWRAARRCWRWAPNSARRQRGNNNAYAQDNAAAWLDWAKADAAARWLRRG